jgi:glycosyltransferase involved in cell wall biosynthesis
LDFDNLVGRVGGKLAGVPVIIASERSNDYTLPGMKKLLERWTLRLSDLILTNSCAGERFLINAKHVPPDRIRVIRNGLDPNLFTSQRSRGEVRQQFSIPKDALVVGMAARRRPEKNFELFFQVAERITGLYPEVWFLQVGDAAPTFESYGKWVEQRRRELTHPNRVILGGHCEDMGSWYRDINLLMITSDREGLPNVLIEAMTIGLPAVTTEVGDNRELLGDEGGFVSAVGDHQAMILGLSKIIENPELRREMGERNRKKALELFSVQRMVSETETTIQEMYRKKQQSVT